MGHSIRLSARFINMVNNRLSAGPRNNCRSAIFSAPPPPPPPPPPPRPRLQLVVARAGRSAFIRQVSTGASAVLASPTATGLVSTASATGLVASTVIRKVPAALVTAAVSSVSCALAPTERCQRITISCQACPGEQVVDPQPVAGQGPAPAVAGAIAPPPVPVMRRWHVAQRDQEDVSRGQQRGELFVRDVGEKRGVAQLRPGGQDRAVTGACAERGAQCRARRRTEQRAD